VTGSEFTGRLNIETDHISNYVSSVFTGEELSVLIDHFEENCNRNELVDRYDHLIGGLKEVFGNEVGVIVESDDLTLADIYDIYMVFVLSLRETVERSTINYYKSIGKPLGKEVLADKIADYCLSDETSLPDDFIRYAAIDSGDCSLLNVNDRINRFEITIDHDILAKYLFHFIETAL